MNIISQIIASVKNTNKQNKVNMNNNLVILKLLNYTIDLNLIDSLCFSFKILGDFHM